YDRLRAADEQMRAQYDILVENERSLRESEEKYRQLAETAHDLIVSVDLNWTITYVNKATLQYSVDVNPVGRRLLDFTSPHLHELQEAIMQKRREGFSDMLAFEWDIYAFGGRTVTFDIRASLLTKDEKPTGVLFVARDITERRKASEALQQRANELMALNALGRTINAILDVDETVNALLKGILEVVRPDLTFLFLRDGERLILMNVLPFSERPRLGHVPEHRVGECLCGLSVQEKQPLFCPDIHRDNRCIGVECKRAGIESFAALPLISGDDVIGVIGLASVTQRDFELRRGFLETMAGQASVALHNARLYEAAKLELAERKQVEDALRNNEELLARLVAAMPDIVLRMDINGEIVFVNDYGLVLSGYAREDLIGQNMLSFIAQEDREKAVRNTVLMYESHLGPQEYHLTMKDGRTRLFEVNGDVLRSEDGTPNGLVHICRDITDRRQEEEEKKRLVERLQRSEKMEALGQLAGGVAHDLNNILGVLSGFSELLMLEIPEGQRSRGHAEKILQSTEKGAAIIQDLLTLTRRGVIASEVVNLNNIISDFIKTPVFEKIKDHHPLVAFRTEHDKSLLNIKGSSVHLEKTVMNLVSNAAESIAGRGEVTIRTESRYLDKPLQGYDEIREGEYAVLTVSDTGIGIPEQDRGKMFEPFYTKKVMGRSGTGLGLAIVWGTVKDHAGYIDVQSELGKGTTFTLYFPITRQKTTVPLHKEPMERYMGHGESVLVVDDIAEQRDVATSLLTTLGYIVHAASSGEEAVEYLRRNRTDIILLDMIMTPGIDGLETYQRILATNPKQKAILVSGFSETERVKEAQRLGAGAYVKKPYILEKIGVAIRDELDRLNPNST
ncbi:MAG: PAS domain S-box protein, partial [Syntrophales bacterium]|nr:PAS domain S-box protein [Syntrophales bacterium]